MQRYMTLVLCVVFFTKYLVADMGMVGKAIALVIEALSFLTFIIFVMTYALKKELYISKDYIAVFFLFSASVVLGAFANGVQPGAVFSGVRNVFMYMPYFLLPLVFRFSEKDISAQIGLLVLFAMMQIPASMYQYLTGPVGKTMDHVVGTLGDSSFLSIYLAGAITMLWAFYLDKKVSRARALVLLVAFVIPTTINETKATIILLFFGILTVSVIFSIRNRSYKLLIVSLVLMVATVILFAILMNVLLQLQGQRFANIFDFYLSGDYVNYLYSGIGENSSRDFGVLIEVGRIDAIIYAWDYVTKDIVHFFFGYGVGNVSEAAASIISGDFDKYAHLAPQMNMITQILWELGLVGLLFLFVGCFMFFRDAYFVSRNSSRFSAFAAGWAGVIVLYVFAFPYKLMLPSDAINVLLWFYSGFLVAEKSRIRAGLSKVSI